MKVVGQPPTRPSAPTVAPGAAKPARHEARTAEAAPASGADTVELSPLARLLQSLRGEVEDPGTVDAARVEELRAALDAGTYEPSSQDVADALLRELAANRLV